MSEKKAAAKITNKAERFGIRIEIPSPFLQEHLEEYQTHLMQIAPREDIANSVYKGAIIKAGIRCGWVSGLAEHEVAKKESYTIRWASLQLHGLLELAQAIPPE